MLALSYFHVKTHRNMYFVIPKSLGQILTLGDHCSSDLNPILGEGGGFKSPFQVFVLHCQAAGERELKFSDF